MLWKESLSRLSRFPCVLGFCCWLTPITPTVLCVSTCSDGLLDFHKTGCPRKETNQTNTQTEQAINKLRLLPTSYRLCAEMQLPLVSPRISVKTLTVIRKIEPPKEERKTSHKARHTPQFVAATLSTRVVAQSAETDWKTVSRELDAINRSAIWARVSKHVIHPPLSHTYWLSRSWPSI